MVEIVFHTNIVSPHQLPWCREFSALVGKANFAYMVEEGWHEQRSALGWKKEMESFTLEITPDNRQQANDMLENCRVLISSYREFDLFERRASKGLLSYYMFERWLKTPIGAWRLLSPLYFQMCRRMLRDASNGVVTLLPIGIPAVEDVLRIHDLVHGHFSVPGHRAKYQIKKPGPMAEIISINYNLDMRLWGYFVEETKTAQMQRSKSSEVLEVLWCGRLLDWKRVDTLVLAVIELLRQNQKIHLKIVGYGPEEERLRSLALNWIADDGSGITFLPPAQIGQVRELMRQADVYVLSSDEGEGWGAVVNEAMNEGCLVVGTYEAGASVTMIEHEKNGFLFHAGDKKQLAEILLRLSTDMSSPGIDRMRQLADHTIRGIWSPKFAANAISAHIKSVL